VSKVIGAVRLEDVRAVHVERLRDALLADGLAPQTTASVLRVLSQALNAAEAKGYVGRNWADHALVRRPTGPTRDFLVIDATLGAAILKAAAGEDPWDAALHLALGLGLRREKVLGLPWSDVDEAVHVRQTLTAAEGSLHVGPPKTAAGRRDLPLPDFVARALARHRTAQTERLFWLGRRSELVVSNAIGEPFHPATFSRMWRDWAKGARVRRHRLHVLRHGAATLLWQPVSRNGGDADDGPWRHADPGQVPGRRE
jgi:integrase